jgi:hypothetical protein
VTGTLKAVSGSAPSKVTVRESQRFSTAGAGAALTREREMARAMSVEIENCIFEDKIRMNGTLVCAKRGFRKIDAIYIGIEVQDL